MWADKQRRRTWQKTLSWAIKMFIRRRLLGCQWLRWGKVIKIVLRANFCVISLTTVFLLWMKYIIVFCKNRLFLIIIFSHTTPCPKKIVPFFYFFSSCPLCGEWCKLHWLLLDTPSFDWNNRRSRGHKIFKMVPTKQQKAFCAVEYAKTTSGAFAVA